MDPGRVLRYARRHAALTQRQLAAKTGVSQPTIARIERGRMNPSVEMFDRLLRACDLQLEATPLLGIGIDRSQIDELLRLTPEQRLDALVEGSLAIDRLVRAAERAD